MLLLVCAALCAGVHLPSPAARARSAASCPRRQRGDADLWLTFVTGAGVVLRGAGHFAGATRDQVRRSAASLRRSVRILHQVRPRTSISTLLSRVHCFCPSRS